MKGAALALGAALAAAACGGADGSGSADGASGGALAPGPGLFGEGGRIGLLVDAGDAGQLVDAGAGQLVDAGAQLVDGGAPGQLVDAGAGPGHPREGCDPGYLDCDGEPGNGCERVTGCPSGGPFDVMRCAYCRGPAAPQCWCLELRPGIDCGLCSSPGS